MRYLRKHKKAVSFLTAAAIAIMANASVAAEAVTETQQLTNINGYMCYERDESYWTMIDGEEYMVFDLDSLAAASKEFYASENSSSTSSTQVIDCPIGKPDQYGWWTYTGWVDLRGGGSYEDRCYLTFGDYYSPIYYISIEPTNGMTYESRFSLSSKVVLPNTYEVTFSFHLQDSIWTLPDTRTVTFSALQHIYMVTTGTCGVNNMDGIAIRFEDSSTGQKELYYTITV